MVQELSKQSLCHCPVQGPRAKDREEAFSRAMGEITSERKMRTHVQPSQSRAKPAALCSTITILTYSCERARGGFFPQGSEALEFGEGLPNLLGLSCFIGRAVLSASVCSGNHYGWLGTKRYTTSAEKVHINSPGWGARSEQPSKCCRDCKGGRLGSHMPGL